MAKSQLNCTGGETVSKWNNAIDKLEAVVNVIRQNFQILNEDYSVCIDKTDTKKTFFYADPPYPLSCRRSINDYRYEFTDKNHEQLADKLHNIQGFAMISSYENKLYNKLYSDWNRVDLPVKKNNIRSGEVQEVIWMNYVVEPSKNKEQLNLFSQQQN
jgi:DNA adenine methylase